MKYRNRNKFAFACSDSCPLCEGSAKIFEGHEGFINKRMEQDVRDIYSLCPNAEEFFNEWDDNPKG